MIQDHAWKPLDHAKRVFPEHGSAVKMEVGVRDNRISQPEPWECPDQKAAEGENQQ
jgi:hypothetical protein